MSEKLSGLGELGGSVDDGDAIATALFIVELFFMFAWLFSPASPIAGILTPHNNLTTGSQVVTAFLPLLVVIIPVTLFGILKNLTQSPESIRAEAFMLVGGAGKGTLVKAAAFTGRTQAKRAYYKKYGRGTRYRQVNKQEENPNGEE